MHLSSLNVISFFFLLLRLLQASDSLTSYYEKDYVAFMELKRQVYDQLLNKFNDLVAPKRADLIPLKDVEFLGWPEQIKSKQSDLWSAKDLLILQNHVNEIQIVFSKTPQEVLMENDSQRMLEGFYSSATFDQFQLSYSLVSVLGTGSFGFVCECKRRSDSMSCAVKFIYRPVLNSMNFTCNRRYGRVPIEVDILEQLDHPGIIKVIDYFDDETYSYMVSEVFGFCWNPFKSDGPRDLFECVRFRHCFSEETIHQIFCQIYEVVRYLRREGIFHGDLKFENILIDSEFGIKLVDFGLALPLPRDLLNREGRLHQVFGTEHLFAPEVLSEDGYLASDSESWSLGVLLYMLKLFKRPFENHMEAVNNRLKLPLNDENGKQNLANELY